MNETLKTIHNLKSTHGNFSDREISNEDLKTILDAGVRAATASSRQSYSIIVIEDRSVMKEYFDYEGSKALLFCVDMNRLVDTAKYLNYEFYTGGIPEFITGSTDTILAVQTAVIAAESLGIDSLITNSVHRNNMEKLYEKFKLPNKYCFPLACLILGYSTDTKQPQKGRLTGTGVVHYGKYHKLENEEIQQLVDLYDNPEMNMGPGHNKDYKRYVDWFYGFWCRQFGDQTEELTAMLRKTGFIK